MTEETQMYNGAGFYQKSLVSMEQVGKQSIQAINNQHVTKKHRSSLEFEG
jgi:hypothetical protein